MRHKCPEVDVTEKHRFSRPPKPKPKQVLVQKERSFIRVPCNLGEWLTPIAKTISPFCSSPQFFWGQGKESLGFSIQLSCWLLLCSGSVRSSSQFPTCWGPAVHLSNCWHTWALPIFLALGSLRVRTFPGLSWPMRETSLHSG